LKTLVLGSYGHNNIGEEAVLMAILKKIGTKGITVVSEKPLLTRGIHHVNSILPVNIEMEEYDRLMIGGCGIFYGDCSFYIGHMLDAYQMNIPVDVLNVGLGPIDEIVWEDAKTAFSIANTISVRNHFSRIILHGLMGINKDIIVEKDISCSLEVPSCKDLLNNLYGEGPYLGLSLKNYKIYYLNLIKAVDKYLKDGYTVVPIFNAWSDFPERLDMLGFSRFERMIKRSFNRWTSPLLPPLITMGVVKEMNKVISHTVHTTIWADHYGIEATALVPENNFHPMAFKDLGAKKIIYTTPPGYIETNATYLSYRGLNWKDIEEYKDENI
jgi:hypothetical protein